VIILKKTASLLLAVCFILPLMLCTAFAQTSKIYDYAELLTQQEEAALQDKALQIGTQYSMDIGVVTVTDRGGKTVSAYADDFYDTNGFGYGSNYDGLIILIDINSRDVFISTSGSGQDYFTDQRLNNIIDQLTPYLSKGEYYNAFMSFFSSAESYIKAGIPSGQHREPSSPESYDEQPAGLAELIALPFIVGIVAGGIACIVVVASYKSNKGATASSYIKNNDIVLIDKQDILVNKFVTFTTNNNNNSGSSVHTSSSGRSHGGAGGKF